MFLSGYIIDHPNPGFNSLYWSGVIFLCLIKVLNMVQSTSWMLVAWKLKPLVLPPIWAFAWIHIWCSSCSLLGPKPVGLSVCGYRSNGANGSGWGRRFLSLPFLASDWTDKATLSVETTRFAARTFWADEANGLCSCPLFFQVWSWPNLKIVPGIVGRMLAWMMLKVYFELQFIFRFEL